MSDLLERLRRTKRVEQRCCDCGHSMKGHSGLRYMGLTVAHRHNYCIHLLHADAEEAADTIEAQAAEIERLREILGQLAHHPAHKDTAMGKRARAALGEDG